MIKKHIKKLVGCGVLGFTLFFVSCEEDIALPDNIVQFEATELGFDSDESALSITLSFSRQASETSIILNSVLTGLTYGVDFTTEPAMEGNLLTLPVSAEAVNVSFLILKSQNALFDGDEKIAFSIAETAQDLVLGERATIEVFFRELISMGATMDPAVGGSLQPNKVFIDLSANRQQSFVRNEWDLGFYTEPGQFRVILNTSSSMLARQIDKNDLNLVTAQDTIGFGMQLSTDAIFAAITSSSPPAWLNGSTNWIDNPTGDMTKTAIAEIAVSDADNKVYIINRGKNPDGTARGWKKVRVVRSGSNYTVQHADIASSTFQSITITRDDTFLFNYLNFSSGGLQVEPAKGRWDIAFTVFTNQTAFGPTTIVPYVFQDIVLQNRLGVQAVQILTSAISYENFGELNLSGLTFNSSQVTIGSTWRTGGGPSGPPALRTDRFYVIKDAVNNYYKLRFTALTQNGERGRPQIEFALVKKGVS
jgi:hypothetical protein